MKMLFLSRDTFPPNRVDVSVLFGKELVGRGYDIDWVLQAEDTSTTSGLRDWYAGRVWVGPTDLGCSVTARIRKHWLGMFHDARMLVTRVRRGKYDVVQVKDKFIIAILAMLVAKLSGTKFVFWLSFPFHEEYLYKARQPGARYPAFYYARGEVFRWILRTLLLPYSSHVFVQSAQMKSDLLAESRVDPSRLTPVPMGVDAEQLDGVIPVERMGSDKWLVYLGALDKERNLDFLLDVVKEVSIQEPRVRLYLVGGSVSPDDEVFLLERAEGIGIRDKVVITGHIPRANALGYVAAADVCLSPYFPVSFLRSTSPTKLVEYMALGKAVVCNDHPEQRMLIENSGGGLCVQYEKAAFVEAVLLLLENSSRASEMGRRGREYVMKHRTYEIIAEHVDRVYGSLHERPLVN